MERRGYLRVGAVLVSMLLSLQGAMMTSAVYAQNHKVQTNSQTQMSSEPEVVYLNNYSNTTKRSQNFDDNWKFYLGEAGQAQEPNFDDSKWRQLSLPHDYSIEQEFSQSMEAESGYLPGGTGWYRKTFTLDESLKDKRVRIDFGGVYMNATVWVNGQQLGTHPYGYTPFSFDITEYVKYGEENVIAVKVDHKTPSSRWYSGSGIYRSVYLTTTDPVSVDLYGTQVTDNLSETKDNSSVNVNIKTNVSNKSSESKTVTLTHTIFEKGKEEAKVGTVTTQGQEITAGQTANISAGITVTNPQLWDTESPTLYTIRTEVKVGDKVVDTYDTEYGFRYFEFNNNTGFSLNGKKMKLKGVSMHHDQGALGAVQNKAAIQRQVDILKEMGCNSIRVTHNPASQELIDICNQEGILVIDEFFDGWMHAKNGNSNDYSVWFNKNIEADNKIIGGNSQMTWAEYDLKTTMNRGKNAPSIIMWSLGNEIQEGAGGSGYSAKADDLIKWSNEVDTTRPLTIGSNAVKRNEREHVEIADKLTNNQPQKGVSGTNYSGGNSYDDLHQKHPNWNLYGSETASSVNSRGVYYHKGTGGRHDSKQLTSYDKSKVGWGALASEAWYDVIKRDFVAGEYVWTGFDYIGEPTPWNGTAPGAQGSWPSPKSSYFGIVDTAGFPKDSYYFYQSQWNDKVNTLHILPTWNQDEIVKDNNGNVEVVVYSDAAKVDLFLNDELIGTKEFETVKTTEGYTYQKIKGSGDDHKNLYMTFSVPYREGTLKAVAYDKDGNVIENTQGRSIVKTTTEPTALKIKTTDKESLADGKDLSYIEVDVLDKDGNVVGDAKNRVTFKVEGNGTLVGVDNGSAPDHDSYKADNREAFSGKVLGIVQSTKKAGDIKVTVEADGLASDTITIKTTPVNDSGVNPSEAVDSFFMSKNYYVKTGSMPVLPQQIETRYLDGTNKQESVTWDTISNDQIAKPGVFTVKGTVSEKYSVSVNINMIDDIAGLLNYSTTVPVGTKPQLPESRPAVMPDGTILSASFPVTWEEPADANYNKEETVVIPGTANVFGKEVKVNASVRVQKEQITIGDSVSSAGKLSQDIPANMQSDTLDAIKDGQTAIGANNDGGPNETAWSNWKNSQESDDKDAEITFEYDTQQRIGEIVIHFARDNASMRYPDANTTKIYISDDGKDGSWKEVSATETIGNEKDRVKPYAYKFEPITATFIKFKITNTNESVGGGKKPCTGITEIELKKAEGKFVTNSTASLQKLVVNGTELSKEVIERGTYSTPAILAEVEAVGAGNAAVTVLPAYNDEIKILIESEDHTKQSVFVIKLNSQEPETPDDPSRDYPVEKITATAGTSNTGSEPDKALDNNPNTHWHTNWAGGATASDNQRWITLTLEEETMIDGLRYLPRSNSGKNGRVTEYKVEYRSSNAKDATWKELATGTWSKDEDGWKLVTFAPVNAKEVRFVGVHTFTDGGNDKHMSAAELRVKKAKETTDISKPENNVTVVADDVKVPRVDAENPATTNVTVKMNDTELKYGIDYLVDYQNNTAVGTATAIVTGIDKYSGTLSDNFEITLEEKQLETISVTTQPKIRYQEGETFDPTGLELTLTYTNGQSEVVTYSDTTKDSFSFSPALGTPLTTDMKNVTVTYAGKSADITIQVDAKSEVTVTKIVVDDNSVKTQYTEGETFNPSGMKVNVNYIDGTAKTISYDESNKSEFTFTPPLDAKLQAGNQVVTVTYAGQSDDVNIRVEKAQSPGNVDRAAAQKFYDECLAYYKAENHSKANWDAYQRAMNELKTVLADKNATQEMINSKFNALIEITKVMNEEIKNNPNNETQNPPKASDIAQTGDKTPITAIVVLMVVALGIVVVVLFKKKKSNKRK